MPQTTEIRIDIEVHRAIEVRRTTFSQSPNDILRATFGLPTVSEIQALPPVSLGPPRAGSKSRRTGAHKLELLGEKIVEGSLKAAYKSCLRRLAELDARFLQRLSERPTRSRRLVARDRRELYLNKPELADDYAEQLADGWWVDINLSRQQVEQRLKTACEVASLEFGVDLVLDCPE